MHDPTTWTRDQAAGIAGQDVDELAEIGMGSNPRPDPTIDLWDPWPLRTRDGHLALVDGAEWWFALSAPAVGHPGGRHDVARLRLHRVTGDQWTDLGPVLPENVGPGSREWAGSAWLHEREVTLFWTAAGDAATGGGFRQRIVAARAPLVDGAPGTWSPPRLVLEPDPTWYRPADEATGEAGFIKAFRDPFRFEDPATGRTHLLFTASLAGSTSAFDGVVGIAVRGDDDLEPWHCQAPLLTADGVNNELERPHVVVHDGRYLLFLSTQARTFTEGVEGRNGLYGWVADELTGPWSPLNGTGLVVANPASEPFQAYSWLVLPDLSVSSFVDNHALGGRHPSEIDEEGVDIARRHFGGMPAPTFALWVDGDRAGLA